MDIGLNQLISHSEKIFEEMSGQFFGSNEILNDDQFGFREGPFYY
jgi:hypothetical protein